MLIKVKFLKGDTPSGRSYIYESGDILVVVGDKVKLPNGSQGIVVEVNVPESEIAAFKDKVKNILGKVEEERENVRKIKAHEEKSLFISA